mgnify:FL=1
MPLRGLAVSPPRKGLKQAPARRILFGANDRRLPRDMPAGYAHVWVAGRQAAHSATGLAVLQDVPFCTAIQAVLHRDTGRFTPRYRPFCRVKRHVPINGWPSGGSAIRAAGLRHRLHSTAQSHAGRWRQARPEGGHGPGRFVMKCIWHDCLSHISGRHTLMCVHLPFE